MKRVYKYIAAMLGMMAFTLQTFAQSDAQRQAESIFQAYQSSPALSFKAVIKMYPAGKPQQLIDQVNADYVLQRDKYYCKMGNVEIVHNSESSLVVDHDDKIVLVGGSHPAQRKSKQEEAAFDLQSLLFRMQLDSVKYTVVQKGAQKELSITGMADPRVRKYRILYDPATFLVKQLQIEMLPEDQTFGKDPLVVDINYYQYNKTPKPDSFFASGKFVDLKGKSTRLKPAYNAYQLVNQL
ncbi:hypothetical protein [Chitinophaga caseinilytica]|uniref:hypothetical protein n=1 Tax=Chitinophaga caseinilytica TaxID=2267521 RepID=UPI003C2FE89A